MSTSIRNIVLFASGSGSNVENIYNYFREEPRIRIVGVLCNRTDAGVIERCKRLKIPLYCFNREAFREENGLLALLTGLKPDLIVLAGFLWKIPESFILQFPQQLINIHPALLPKYGGKGMYGSHVHQAVSNSGDIKTGITIHWVNSAYDEGGIILQKQVTIEAGENPENIASKVHQLEYTHYPEVIAGLLLSNGS